MVRSVIVLHLSYAGHLWFMYVESSLVVVGNDNQLGLDAIALLVSYRRYR